MKLKKMKIPYWVAWQNLMPGPGSRKTLNITGWVYSDLFQQPYLKPLKEPLLFELAFRHLKRPPHFPVDLQVPKQVDPYRQPMADIQDIVTIRIPGQKNPVQIPIEIVT
jgi:hypothetical protein